MPASHLGRRRSRPVADAPALDGAELAKAWLVELVAVAPLECAARLPGPRFADDAPRLCAAVMAALSSDAGLDDLEPGGPLAPLAAASGHLAGAPGPLEAVGALDALRTVAWASLVDAADRPVPAMLADLADRLGTVIATLTTAALETPHPLGPTRPGDRGPLAAVLREARPATEADDTGAPSGGAETETETDEELDGGAAASSRAAGEAVAWVVDDAPRVEVDAPAARVAPVAPPRGSVIDRRTPAADALAQIEATLRDAAQAADPLAEAAARLQALAQTIDVDDASDPFDAAATRLRSVSEPLEEPRIRRMPVVEDATEFAGARVTPWAASIERRLTRHRGDGLPFAVLCLEFADVGRLVPADVDGDVVAALEAAESAILAQLRPADALIREQPGRYWLTTPDTDTADARALAHRIASAVADLPAHRGAPLQICAGVTTCPEDGSDTPTLERAADEALFAAVAAGLRVSGPPA